MTPLEILKACAASEDTRYTLKLPFQQGEYACATNGHIAARTKAIKFAPQPGDNYPPMGELPWGMAGVVTPLSDVPVLDPPKKCECDSGTRRCGNCRGKGCWRCDYEGKIMCECDDGIMHDPRNGYGIQVGTTWLAWQYIQLLRSFGVTEVTVLDSATDYKIVAWKVGDVEGLLCSTLNHDGDEILRQMRTKLRLQDPPKPPKKGKK